jgi:hypothetical protein
MLLLLALAAMVLSCLLMVLELARYGFEFKPTASRGSPAPAASVEAFLV